MKLKIKEVKMVIKPVYNKLVLGCSVYTGVKVDGGGQLSLLSDLMQY